jgi:hypothetical protein
MTFRVLQIFSYRTASVSFVTSRRFHSRRHIDLALIASDMCR